MNRIKKLRTSKNLSQQDLAAQLNIDVSTLSRYENNKANLTREVLLQLSNIFNVSTDYILKNSNHSDIEDNNTDLHHMLLLIVQHLKYAQVVCYKNQPLSLKIREFILMLVYHMVKVLECVVLWQ